MGNSSGKCNSHLQNSPPMRRLEDWKDQHSRYITFMFVSCHCMSWVLSYKKITTNISIHFNLLAVFKFRVRHNFNSFQRGLEKFRTIIRELSNTQSQHEYMY